MHVSFIWSATALLYREEDGKYAMLDAWVTDGDAESHLSLPVVHGKCSEAESEGVLADRDTAHIHSRERSCLPRRTPEMMELFIRGQHNIIDTVMYYQS